jgi:uncharacterized protein
MYLAIGWGDLYYRFLNSYTKQVIDEVFFLILQLLPYLVVGILLSTLIRRYISAETLKHFLSGKNSLISIVVAAFLGILSPLGSYVVIPLSAALVLAGLPLAPVVAFLVSSPLINPALFLLTLGALGPEMAIMRCVSAFLIGVSAGLLTLYGFKKGDTGVKAAPEGDTSKLIIHRSFWEEAWRYTRYISKHFFLGIFIAALTKVLIPVSWITSFLGTDHVVSVFAATLAAVPFYSCGGAAIPVVQQLADMGVDKGAILAYFIAGPTTKIANIVVLASVYRKGIVYIYFLISFIGAIVMGLLYHYF